MSNLNPRQFGEQHELFDTSHMRFPHAPATGPQGAPPKPSNWDTATDNKHGVYLRFGDWPADERSHNNAFGGKEEGVSVYSMGNTHAEPIDPDPHDSRYEYDLENARAWHKDLYGTDEDFDENDHMDSIRGNDTGEEMMGRRSRGIRNPGIPAYRGHFVKGDLAGFGHDDEPLLNNVRAVGEWPKDAHRFVTGSQPPLWTKWNRNIGGDV